MNGVTRDGTERWEETELSTLFPLERPMVKGPYGRRLANRGRTGRFYVRNTLIEHELSRYPF